MKNIEINNENVKIYQEFYNTILGSNTPFYLELLKIILTSSIAIVELLAMFPYTYIVIKILTTFSAIPHSETIINIFKVAMYGYIILCGIAAAPIVKTIYNKIYTINIKKFEKKYPDFDTNIDVIELAEELTNYRKLSKNIKKQKEKYIKNSQKVFKNMSTEEKLAYLEQEKEFWQKVQANEELTQEKIETFEIGYQKKIGGINN